MPREAWPFFMDETAVLEALGEATGLAPAEVRGRLSRECLWPGWNSMAELCRRRIKPHVYSPGMAEFYEGAAAALFGGVVWNGNPLKRRMRRWIRRRLGRAGSGLETLCFGDGLGVESAALARAGHLVTYFDPSGPATVFARSLFVREGVAVRQVRALDELAGSSFDAVLCLDVLEHVPDPEGLLRGLAGLLKPAGELYLHAPFGSISLSLPLHLAEHRRLSGRTALFQRCELEPVGAAWLWMPIVLRRADGGRQPAASAYVGLNGWLLRALAAPPVFAVLDLLFHCLNAVCTLANWSFRWCHAFRNFRNPA
ncbi:MAG: methyltransferase domain-containing protein [Elusimicrobia bacterium]|nr:methyltransferase domain-containing protein [Elusimicrobiota bacterium]